MNTRIDVAAVVLAAGQAARFGATKMVAQLHGKPLVRYAVEAALASRASPVLAVLDPSAEDVRAALAGLDVCCVPAANAALGLGHSLRAGLMATPPNCAGAIVLLGDMPLIRADLIDRLIAEFAASTQPALIPVHAGRRGNPAVIGRTLFSAVMRLDGDRGAGQILDETALKYVVDDAAVVTDVDTPEDLRRLNETPLARPGRALRREL